MQYDWFIRISVEEVEPLALEARNISLTHIRSCSDKTEILELPLPHIHSGIISASACHTPQPLLPWLVSFFYLFLALYHFYWVASSKGTGNDGEWEKEWAWKMLWARFELDPPHEHHSQMCFSISANLFFIRYPNKWQKSIYFVCSVLQIRSNGFISCLSSLFNLLINQPAWNTNELPSCTEYYEKLL